MENLENRKTYRRVRLNSTVKLMTSTDPKERLKAEYQQLLIRIEGLIDTIKCYNGTLTPLELDLYQQQLIAMNSYKNVLELRASIQNIEIN